jgi:hypothetical protein
MKSISAVRVTGWEAHPGQVKADEGLTATAKEHESMTHPANQAHSSVRMLPLSSVKVGHDHQPGTSNSMGLKVLMPIVFH